MKWGSFNTGPQLSRQPRKVALGCSVRDEPVSEPRSVQKVEHDARAEQCIIVFDRPVPLRSVVSAGPAGAGVVVQIADDGSAVVDADLKVDEGQTVNVTVNNSAAQIDAYIDSGATDGLDLRHAIYATIRPIDAEDRDILQARAGVFPTFGQKVHTEYVKALAMAVAGRPDAPADQLEHAIVSSLNSGERAALAEFRAWSLAYARALAVEACTGIHLPDERTLQYQVFARQIRDPSHDIPDDQRAAMMRMAVELPREIRAHMDRMDEVGRRGKS